MNWNWDNIVKILQSLSIIAVSVTAFFGINAWRKEFLGKKKIELAEEVIALFYKCKDNIKMIRNPFNLPNEAPHRKKDDDEDQSTSYLLDHAHIVFERYDKVKDDFNKLISLKYRFMTIIGEQHESLFEDLNTIVNKILNSAHLLSTIYWKNHSKRKQMSIEEKAIHLKEQIENEAILWDLDEKNNVINNDLENLINKLKKACTIIFKIN